MTWSWMQERAQRAKEYRDGRALDRRSAPSTRRNTAMVRPWIVGARPARDRTSIIAVCRALGALLRFKSIK